MTNKITLSTIANRLNDTITLIDGFKNGKTFTVKIGEKERQGTTSDVLDFIENKITFALMDLAELQDDLKALAGEEIE